MKFVSYQYKGKIRSGFFINNRVYDIAESAKTISIDLPTTMLELLFMEEEGMEKALRVQQALLAAEKAVHVENPILSAPVPRPPSCRDAYAFRQHVATARRNRGVEMIPEFDQYPIFYFTNHNAIFGEGDIYVEDDHLQKLDFELELAIIVGKSGMNISAKNADKHIAGYTIMNDLSARVLQMEEMKLNLGPAKGKDFATTIGPWMVTPDELAQYKISTDFGDKYDLKMEAFHNTKKVSEGNAKDMNWTFAEIIERASYGVEIFPGDVIGSGTVGTGCYLELNGTGALQAKEKNEEFTATWLNDGDSIELKISGLGSLKNKIVKSPLNNSILAKKKLSK